MKRWKYSVFFMLVMVLGLIGTDFRMQAGVAYAKEEEITAYQFTSEDTIEIYESNLSNRDARQREQFKKVKHIRVMGDYQYFHLLSYFPNAETLYISKDTISLSDIEWRYETLWNLKEITVDPNNPVYESYQGALFTKSLYKLLLYPARGEKKAVIPAKTRIIGEKAFWNAGITSVEIPEGLQVIQSKAFANTKLTEISLPATFRTIEKDAFLDTPLTNVTIAKENASLISIDGVLFSKDKTDLYYWPEQKKVKNLILPDQLEYLNCSMIPTFHEISTITIPKNLSAIAYTETNHIKEIILPKENKNFCLYDGVLYSSNEKEIRLYPNDNPDDTIVINPLLERFPMELFYEENTTKTLTLPKGLLKLDGIRKWQQVLLGGFSNLSELKIEGENENFTLADGVLYNKEKTALLWYPINLDQKIFSIPDTVKIVENDQLVKQSHLEKLIIPAGCRLYDFSIYEEVYETHYEMPVGKYCPNLKEFAVAKESQYYTVKAGVLFSKNMTILLGYPSAKKEISYEIPDSILIAPFGNANPYLEVLIFPANTTSIGSDMAVETYDYEGMGLLHYSALKEIKVDDKNTLFTAKNGILYEKSWEDRIQLWIYPMAKKDADFYLPKETTNIINPAYLEENPYLKRIYVTSGGEYHDIEDGRLWMEDAYQKYLFDGIELIEK